jgi:metal-responsive CopG/Arc/MetJ family transcriptional regulator
MKSGATKTGNKVVVSFALPDNIVQYIDEMAKKENRCRSNFIETLLRRVLENEAQQENNETEEKIK